MIRGLIVIRFLTPFFPAILLKLQSILTIAARNPRHAAASTGLSAYSLAEAQYDL